MTLRAIKNSLGSSEELGLLGLGAAQTERDCLMSVVVFFSGAEACLTEKIFDSAHVRWICNGPKVARGKPEAMEINRKA